MSKEPEVYFISAYCCAQGCRKVTHSARKLSDFFITMCVYHEGKTIKLDMSKIVPFKTGKKSH